jgi:hypothetical protein
MLSKNEWDPLKSVIVGIADNAKIPQSNIGLRTVNYADLTFSEYLQVKHGRYPEQVIEEANEDLERLCQFLRDEDIHVGRPTRSDPEYYNYCPRDTVLIHDDLILATPMALSSRRDEWRASKSYFDLDKLVVAPKPESTNTYNSGCLGNPNVFTNVLTESTIRTNTFTYTGSTIPSVTYRVYTTYPATNFLIDNQITDIYFKGGSIG